MRSFALILATWSSVVLAARQKEYPSKSGIKTWVDPATPANVQQITTSRGETWQLVMSDEFNTKNRSFRPGDDHLWTSLDKPDGVNGALEVYSHNMTSTKCDDDGTCYFYIEAVDDLTELSIYNSYLNPPQYENVSFFYRAGMVQSWNKFCYQGGLIEVRAQLPGAISKQSGNPDLALGKSGQVASGNYYPTWPGIWMMGNLGRAIFSASTSRMWPFSYNKCEPDIFEPSNQRISACDDNPGYGLHKNQGRGAPEIDILEGGGLAISSSLQIAPGMPSDFRLFPAEEKYDSENIYCVYQYNCKTPGANLIDIPTSYYEKERGHKSWYQGLRYASNNFCSPSADEKQSVGTVKAALQAGITENTCTPDTCPASLDPNSDLDLIDGTGPSNWGINSNGTCFPVMNSYMGAYLCDPDNTDKNCLEPRNSTTPKTNAMEPFNYQMDAISANWPVHLGAYTDYFVYQVEWVTGKSGYVRWMGAGQPLFEVTAESFSIVPQNDKKNNPQKLMLEEPMSIILNVALSRSWGAAPPNAGSECRGDGSDESVNKICDDFPMFLKIDYIRLYQDPKGNRGPDDYMQLGCDPASHPTREWIQGHLDEYQDWDNPWTEVVGKGFCEVDSDCTIGSNGTRRLVTGKCVNSRCSCSYPDSWGGPRCTFALAEESSSNSITERTYGPPMAISLSVAIVTLFSTFIAAGMSVRSLKKQAEQAIQAAELKKQEQSRPSFPMRVNLSIDENETPKDNYSQNFL
ncbi:Beta-glucan synthesis-associated protein SKN1 [Phytophthora citrophthora]|uniref:Beta-glucan synthesis-associated protein SKN1 n=1 Tax=Phytophthora citrophthora TaxID=4793 RepID=A0AAD9G8K9_9STRA|nr:Beta-glucan synthesis-associated protein SKN1 [Phytophthora citrophthora]